jgi:hypothetical protein
MYKVYGGAGSREMGGLVLILLCEMVTVMLII